MNSSFLNEINSFAERWISVFELPNENLSREEFLEKRNKKSKKQQQQQGQQQNVPQNDNSTSSSPKSHLWGILTVGRIPGVDINNNSNDEDDDDNDGMMMMMRDSNHQKQQKQYSSSSGVHALEFYKRHVSGRQIRDVEISFVVFSFDYNSYNNNPSNSSFTQKPQKPPKFTEILNLGDDEC